jgi:dipeptidyl aminopeptidase/acylaminoacyl peptidase
VWNARNGVQLLVLKGHSAEVNWAFYSPDGSRIVTASADKTARVWDSTTGGQLLVLSGHAASVNSALYSPDGKHIVTGSVDGTARIWDAVAGVQLALLSGHSDHISAAIYSPDGKRVMTASNDKTVRIWNAQTEPLDAQIAYVEAAEFDPLSAAQRFQLGLPEQRQRLASRAGPTAPGTFAIKAEALELAGENSATGLSPAALLTAFRDYAAAARGAQERGWPERRWRVWRYRRASIARLLAREGMTLQVVKAYRGVAQTP